MAVLRALLLATLCGVACSRPAPRTASAAIAIGADNSTAQRPNIVFVLLDDARYDDLIDHPFADLPNIKRLVAEGASFQRFFTSAPLCSPSRAVFMTGQYPYRNGIVDNAERAAQSHEITTFPKLLHDAGYHTGFFGKWHMGHQDDSPRPGFDRWVSFVGQGVYFDPDLNIDGKPAKAKGYMTDILTAEAVTFVREAPVGKPFLVVVAQKAVHPEIHPNFVRSFPPAPGDEHLYEHDSVPHAPNWRASTSGKPALQLPHDTTDPRSPRGGLPDSVVKDRLRMLSAVDRSLGSLISALKARGDYDQTVFVVTSDQGFFYGEFGLAQERRLAYEPSIHVPLIVRYPAMVKGGTEPQTLASNVDVAPTLLALGGVTVPATMHGRSLLPALGAGGSSIRDELLIEYYSDTEFPRLKGLGYKAVRTDRYKFIRYTELKGMDELYDLRNDPHELHNLLPNEVPAGVLADLTIRLDRLLGVKP